MPTTGSAHLEATDSNELDDLDRGRIPDEEAQIGGQPESSAQTVNPAENENDDSEAPSGGTLDEDELLGESLKAETGYSSYLDYLDAYGMNFRARFLRARLKEIIADGRDFSYDGCAILDIQDQDSTCCKLTLRRVSTSGTEVLSSLRHPSATTKFRIVLWDSTNLRKSTLDALGLGLKIHPHFFETLAARHPRVPGSVGPGSLSDDVLVIGQYVMILIRDYLPGNPDAAPIILIAAVHRRQPGAYSSQFNQPFLFQELATPATNSTPDLLTRLPEWMEAYLRGLESDLKKTRGGIGNDMDLIAGPLTALLQLHIPLVRLQCRATRAYFLSVTMARDMKTVGKLPEDLFETRYLLRRMIEDSGDNSQRLRDYRRFPTKDDTPQSQRLMDLERDLQQIRLEASRLESEIRDYLQLQNGESALQESKKSIELSNFQIEEAKRG